MKLKAQYLDGKSPIEQEIDVQWISGAWVLGELQGTWLADDVKIETIADELHVTHKRSGESLLLKGFSQEDWERLGLRNLRRSPRSKARLAVILTVVTVGIFLGIYTSIHPLSYRLAQQIPSASERQIFDHLTPMAYLNESRCTQWDAQKTLQVLGNGLLEADDPSLTFEVLNWKEPNAFAFPGRRIYVTQGLLDRLQSSEQLLAVLAHEKGHIDLRHNLGETIDSLIRAFLWSVAVGDFSGAFIIDPKVAKTISQASYSRELEGAADAYGAGKLLSRGFDPKALGSALRQIAETKVEEDEKKTMPKVLDKFLQAIDRIFASHPETEARIEELRKAYPVTQTREPLNADQWNFLKGACKAEAKD